MDNENDSDVDNNPTDMNNKDSTSDNPNIENMSANQDSERKEEPSIHEVLPKGGLLFQECLPSAILCKPKLLPIKSHTLERAENIQKNAQEALIASERDAKFQAESVLREASNTAAQSFDG